MLARILVPSVDDAIVLRNDKNIKNAGLKLKSRRVKCDTRDKALCPTGTGGEKHKEENFMENAQAY